MYNFKNNLVIFIVIFKYLFMFGKEKNKKINTYINEISLYCYT